MSNPTVEQLATCVTAHAFNADRSLLAFCPDNNEVHIYKKAGAGWEKQWVLTEHDHVVTGIDWAPKTNRIVTCSQDRNAYVWTFQDGQWKPTLVILRINRAATHVKWSPDEQKFAVASGAKCVSVCYFEEDNDWWVSKHIKKHKSTVTSVAWHPNGIFLATGASDFKARIFSAFIKGLDRNPGVTPFGDKLPFGNLLAEYSTSGWVHSVAWSPSGNVLAFVAHDSRVHFVDINSGAIDKLSLTTLPYRQILFISEDSAVAVGYDCAPHLFSGGASGWRFVRSLDEAKVEQAAKVSATAQARNVFVNKVEYGSDTNETTLTTQHQNSISCIQPFAASGPKVTKFSTTGVDGKLVLWNC